MGDAYDAMDLTDPVVYERRRKDREFKERALKVLDDVLAENGWDPAKSYPIESQKFALATIRADFVDALDHL